MLDQHRDADQATADLEDGVPALVELGAPPHQTAGEQSPFMITTVQLAPL